MFVLIQAADLNLNIYLPKGAVMKKLVCLVLLLAFMAGCVTDSAQKQGTAYGAAGGAALGALLGQVVGRDTKSTLLGAAIGAAIGGLAGNQYGKNVDDTIAEYNQKEKTLDERINYAAALNQSLKDYNSVLEQKIAALTNDYNREKIQAANLDGEHKMADNTLKKVNTEVANLKKSTKKQKKTQEVAELDRKIKELEQSKAELEENMKEIALIKRGRL